jgi:putative membrane protein insertion efficiency factor
VKDRARQAVILFLRGYKWAISPLFLPACRYTPTCSEYATEAIDRFGVLRGVGMAMLRVLRCHPFAKGGYDPVVGDQEICGEATCCASNATQGAR